MSNKKQDKQLVETPPQEPFQLKLLSSKNEVDHYYGYCKPYLEECLEGIEEFASTDSIYTNLLSGNMYGLIAKRDKGAEPEVGMVMIMAINHYPDLRTMNIFALGGKDLVKMVEAHWRDIQGWAKVMGVYDFECCAGPKMSVILRKKLGFVHQFDQLRLKME